MAILSTKPSLLNVSQTRTSRYLRKKKTKNKKQPTDSKYLLIGCMDKQDQWDKAFGALPTPSVHPEWVVFGPPSYSHLTSLIRSDTLSSLETIFSYSWHILTVLELCLTRKCQMALNHQLLNIQEQYYIQNRTMYGLIKGLCWYLGNLRMPQSPPQLCRDNLYGLGTLSPSLLLLLYLQHLNILNLSSLWFKVLDSTPPSLEVLLESLLNALL